MTKYRERYGSSRKYRIPKAIVRAAAAAQKQPWDVRNGLCPHPPPYKRKFPTRGAARRGLKAIPGQHGGIYRCPKYDAAIPHRTDTDPELSGTAFDCKEIF